MSYKLSPRENRRAKVKKKNFENKNIDKIDVKFYNYVLTIIYDGSTYGGYAKQKFSNTIEETLNNKIDEYIGEHVKIINASRTDAKVHALDQKVMFKSSKKIQNSKFLNFMNENLPKTIEIINIEIEDDNFHVRYNVVNKTYMYKIHTAKNIFLNNYSYFWDIDNIDVLRINEICSLFIGKKDFIAFSSPKKDAVNTIRTINFFTFDKIDNNNYIFRINSDGFLYNMVRIIVATVIYCYENNISNDDIISIIESKDRSKTRPKICASGLYLECINFSN